MQASASSVLSASIVRICRSDEVEREVEAQQRRLGGLKTSSASRGDVTAIKSERLQRSARGLIHH